MTDELKVIAYYPDREIKLERLSHEEWDRITKDHPDAVGTPVYWCLTIKIWPKPEPPVTITIDGRVVKL
jgi:hypothetical protein